VRRGLAFSARRRQSRRRQLLRCHGSRRLEPTRRVELPLDGLRDRYTSVVLRGQAQHESCVWSRRPELNRPVSVWRTELSPRHTCLAVLCGQHLISRITVGAIAAFGDSSRGSGRIRTDVLSGPGDRWPRAEGARCNPVLLPIHLESGITDSCRKGYPATVSVPPSGIEPEPLGLQPSAQTNYARVGYERRTPESIAKHIARDPFAAAGGADHHHRSSVVRERCAAGAPQAFMRSLWRRAHLGRQCIRLLRGRTYRDSRS
jgi:hypothetical protein